MESYSLAARSAAAAPVPHPPMARAGLRQVASYLERPHIRAAAGVILKSV